MIPSTIKRVSSGSFASTTLIAVSRPVESSSVTVGPAACAAASAARRRSPQSKRCCRWKLPRASFASSASSENAASAKTVSSRCRTPSRSASFSLFGRPAPTKSQFLSYSSSLTPTNTQTLCMQPFSRSVGCHCTVGHEKSRKRLNTRAVLLFHWGMVRTHSVQRHWQENPEHAGS